MIALRVIGVVTSLAATIVVNISAQKAPAPVGCSRGPADTKTIQISATFAQPFAAVAHAIDSILPALGYTIDSAASSPGRWVSDVRTSWPQGTEEEKWHGSESPGVKVIVRAASRGDSTSFVVDGQAVCTLESAEADAQPGSVSGMLEMIAAVQVASSLSTAFKGKAPH